MTVTVRPNPFTMVLFDADGIARVVGEVAALVGFPRADALVNGAFDGPAVREAIGLDPARPTALYAPTWSPASSLNLAGEAIVAQGEVGDAFFIIVGGRVRVDVDGELRRHEGPGEFFGEIALVRDVPRTATVTALAPVEVLVVDREHFLAAIDAHPRSARVAESVARDRLIADAAAAPP